jgi:hypothetical protein
MKNVRAVLMYVDSINISCVDISRNMISPVNYQNALTTVGGLPGKNASEEARTHHQIVVLFHHASKSPKVVTWDYWISGVASLLVS